MIYTTTMNKFHDKAKSMAKRAGVGLLTFFMLKGIGWLILLYLGVEFFT